MPKSTPSCAFAQSSIYFRPDDSGVFQKITWRNCIFFHKISPLSTRRFPISHGLPICGFQVLQSTGNLKAGAFPVVCISQCWHLLVFPILSQQSFFLSPEQSKNNPHLHPHPILFKKNFKLSFNVSENSILAGIIDIRIIFRIMFSCQ